MARVTGKFPHITSFGREASFTLDSDQAMNPYTWKPPIKWTGFVNGESVEFTQTSASGWSKDDYDFEGFPEDLKSAIPYIVDVIDNKLKVMD